MTDDMLFDIAHARELIRNSAADVFNLYPGKQGGIGRACEIARLAAEHGIPCSIGSNLEWDIATAAMCHFVVSSPNMNIEQWPGDVLGPIYHEERLVTKPIAIDGPWVTTPDSPGLGVDVDWAKVDQHRMSCDAWS